MQAARKFCVGDVVVMPSHVEFPMTVNGYVPGDEATPWMVAVMGVTHQGELFVHHLREEALVKLTDVLKYEELEDKVSVLATELKQLYKERDAERKAKDGMAEQFLKCADRLLECTQIKVEYEDWLVELGVLKPANERQHLTRAEWDYRGILGRKE